MWDGKVIFVVAVAVVFAALAGRIVAARYRTRVLALMSGGSPPSDATGARGPAAAVTAPPAPSASSVSPAQNRRARRRLAHQAARDGTPLRLGHGPGLGPALALELAAQHGLERRLHGGSGHAGLAALNRCPASARGARVARHHDSAAAAGVCPGL